MHPFLIGALCLSWIPIIGIIAAVIAAIGIATDPKKYKGKGWLILAVASTIFFWYILAAAASITL